MIEAGLRQLVAEAVAPLVDEVAALRRQVRQLSEVLPRRWISRATAADEDGVSVDSIDRRIAEGVIVVKRIGRRVLIDAASLRPATSAEVNRAAAEARNAR